MVFCRVCKSILIPIVSTYFSKFLVILQRAHKTAGITSQDRRYHVNSVKVPKSPNLSFEILILFNLLFLINYSVIPRYCDIYNDCCLLLFIDNKCGPFSKMTLSHCAFKSHISLWLTFSLTV